MIREATLPPEWAVLRGKVNYVQRESAKTYTCSCPFCGGEIHPNGELPDRCTLFVDTHPTLYCRVCGKVAYPDNFGDGTYRRPSQAELQERRRELIQREEARKRSAERALVALRNDRMWVRYHEQLNGTGRLYWERRGLSDFWQDFWQLGWQPRSPWQCATATIPLFAQAWQPLNIKHRLIGVEKGKYRYELAGQLQPMFLCNPGEPVAGHVYAVEGEIKAMVTFATLDSGEVCMVGLPGTSPALPIIEQLQQAERITLIMDPGAEEQAHDLALRIGAAKCRLLIPPMKIDDGILAAGLSGADVRRILAQAAPL